jgi:hypothetical protein
LTLTKTSRSPYRIGTLNLEIEEVTGPVEKGGGEEEGEEAAEEAEDSAGIGEIGATGAIEVIEGREDEIEIKIITTIQIKRRCMWIRTLA